MRMEHRETKTQKENSERVRRRNTERNLKQPVLIWAALTDVAFQCRSGGILPVKRNLFS